MGAPTQHQGAIRGRRPSAGCLVMTGDPPYLLSQTVTSRAMRPTDLGSRPAQDSPSDLSLGRQAGAGQTTRPPVLSEERQGEFYLTLSFIRTVWKLPRSFARSPPSRSARTASAWSGNRLIGTQPGSQPRSRQIGNAQGSLSVGS